MKCMYIIVCLIGFLSCNNKVDTVREIIISDKIKNTLELNVDFSDSLNISKELNVIDWDTLKYNFEDEQPKYLLYLRYKDSLSYTIQIPLVAIRIPFLFQFNRINQNEIYVNAIQQFNTVWGDSLVFERQDDKYIIKEAFRGSYKGNSNIFPLKITRMDSLVILE